ncbi:hypothetical protein FQR65_LT00902 [Abscondita terminalis]|nr:hypothetical protein FQR65_LT00902 [Abscondita terminalis]
MKTLNVLLLCATFVVNSKAFVTKTLEQVNLQEIDSQCYSQFGKGLKVFDNDGYLIEDNETINHILRCTWEKIGVVSEGGLDLYKLHRILEDNLKDQYNNYVRTYLASRTVQSCVGIQGQNLGDICVKTYNCIFRQLSKSIKLLTEEAAS